MRFNRNESPSPGNRRVVRWWFGQPQAQKVAQRQRIRRAPGDATLRIDAFEVPDQQQPEIDARRQARPPHRLGVKAGALRLDEIVEIMLTQQLIQTSIKRMARSRRQVRAGDPHRWLPIPFAFAHRHGRSVEVRDVGRVDHSARAATRVTIVEAPERSCGSKGDVSSMSPLLRPSAPAGQPRWCSGVVIAAAILGAAAPLFGRQGPPLLPGYVIVGEALSSARAEDSIQFAARMFSAPDMESICCTARAAEVVQLRSEVSQLRLRLGEPFRPGTLRITARDASGAVLPNVPLAVEVSGPPNVFARERLAQLVEDGSIIPRSPASVRFRVRTICPGAGADTFVRAEISQE